MNTYNIRIYGLIDPRDNNCFYVGRTKHSLDRRLKEHFKKDRNPVKRSIMNDIVDQGLSVGIMEYAYELNLTEEDAIKLEGVWIEFIGLTNRLTNKQKASAGNFENGKLREWISSEIELLGTDSDERVAAIIGCSAACVRTKRIELGVTPAHKSCRDWVLPKHIELLLGTVPDTTLARSIGVSSSTICRHREKRGIPKYSIEVIDKYPEMMGDFGTMGDEQIAEKHGICRVTVRKVRKLVGASAKRKLWTNEDDLIVLTNTVKDAMQLTGRSRGSISGRLSILRSK